ncbi:MAG: di-trans,poly-cis-decaprenylcistransferase [Campylobacterota bacterium]|nr:di-trans,poly-cis-decaprenylcistransferase [Campylobacterota bacterium]
MNCNKLPQHIAIIMDGNGRWAKQKGLKRTAGHEEGAKTVREITTFCSNLGIKYLTLYAFSTENWNRPKLEIEFLMKLLKRYFEKELDTYLKNNIRFQYIGDISKFSKELQKTIQNTVNKTKHLTGMIQTIALNYGSRDEMVRAVKAIKNEGIDISEENISKNLDTSGFPDVDLLVRTSGEIRLSNFLLWQSAYAELHFTKTLWPDFKTEELEDIIDSYIKRERRYGRV